MGKSFVYFIAIKLLREGDAGPALLISPLLSLMRNQIAAAERMGVRAVTINSDNTEDWADVEAIIRRDEVDVLLVSPERLANEGFRGRVLAAIGDRISLLVIDEAHCISDWGHDFRPHYRLLERLVPTLPLNLRLLTTTATANDRVMDDLGTVLGPDLKVSRGDLGRPSLTPSDDQAPDPGRTSCMACRTGSCSARKRHNLHAYGSRCWPGGGMVEIKGAQRRSLYRSDWGSPSGVGTSAAG